MKANDHLKYISKLVTSEDYLQALEELNKSAKTICQNLNKFEIGELYYYWGVSLYEHGDNKKALYKFKVALFMLRDSNDHLLYARAKYYFGRVLILLGRVHDSLEIFTESFLYYKRIRKYDEIYIPLDNIAQVHFILGNLKKSIEVLKQKMEYVKRINDDYLVQGTYRKLARVLVFAGEFNEAINTLNAVEDRILDWQGKAHFLILHGMLNIFKFNHDKAESFLNRAKDIFSEHKIARDIAVCLEYLGLNQYYQGNYDKALEYYRQVLDMPEPTAAAVSQTTRLLTDVYIAQGNAELAEETAQKAEKAIRKINEQIELGALWRAYGQIHAMKEEPEKAREYFSRSSELLRTVGARYELAQTCLACGKSPAFEKDECLSYLSTAHSLFSEMGVDPRLEEIDELSKTFRTQQSTWQIQDRADESAPVIIAKNRLMRDLIAQAEQLAPHNLSVLLTGDTGTGKDLMAKYIHHVSGRKGPFVMVNSAAIPNDMVEAELFGYSKGAFTSADHEREGLIKMAADGTLYLNEIVDASLIFQAKLLEVLETHRVRRLGENKVREIDFRLICATNHKMEDELKQNRFRMDFYHRINEANIHLPRLDDRPEDIPDLALHFMKTLLDGFPSNGGYKNEICEICKLLGKQRWPGNVRELRAEIKRLWVVAHGSIEGVLELVRRHVEQDTREIFMATLEDTNWNKRETARRLGISDGTVRNWIRKYSF